MAMHHQQRNKQTVMIQEINEENSTILSGEDPGPNIVEAHMKELTDPNSGEIEASHMKREADL